MVAGGGLLERLDDACLEERPLVWLVYHPHTLAVDGLHVALLRE